MLLENPVNKGKTVFFCEALRLSRQGCYEYLKRRDNPYKYALLAAEMRKIIDEDVYNDTYGYVRMCEAPKFKAAQNARNGEDFPHVPCERTVCRVMKREGLTHRPRRKPNGMTKADREAMKSDNYL
jgi:hypothetical protein